MKLSILFASVIFCFSFSSKGQLCNGNLGDPIINMTFGSGGFALPLNATTFTAVNDCPKKGEYIISSFLYGCGSNDDHSWLQMIGDHTHNSNGNYMLVNAESTAGTIFTDTAKNLCDNTNYVFSGWISNAMQNFSCGGTPILANVTFTVKKPDGTILAIDSTGDIPVAFDRIWKEYGVSFVTPPNTPSVIASVTVNPKYGCGSVFVIDDITLRSCGPAVNITLDGSTESGNVCSDYTNPFILQGSYSSGLNDPVVQWQNSFDTGKTWSDIQGETNTTYAIPKRNSGEISYRMVIAERGSINSINCRIASNDIYTEVHPQPAHNPPQNILGCLDKDLSLPEADPSALQVLWNGPNSYSSTEYAAIVPKVQYNDTGLYQLKETFYFGCISLDTFYLKIFPSTTIYAEPSYPICEGSSETISVSSTGGGTYKWYPSAGLSNDTVANPIARPTDSTEYKVVVTNLYGCKDSAFLNIDVYRKPFVNAGIDKVILAGDTAVLNGIVKGTSVDFLWSPSAYLNDAHSATPNAFPQQTMIYNLTASSNVGCGSAIDNVIVKVYTDIFIPTAFTPNGDGKNDYFKVLPLDNYKLVQLVIYNRWGQLLFKTSDKYKGWDGSFKGIIQPTGSYIYRLEMIGPFNKSIIKQGTVLLLQ